MGLPELACLDLDLVVRSHGWYDLPPFRYDEKKRALELVVLHGDRPVPVTLRQRRKKVEVAFDGERHRPAVERAVRRVLDLDAALGPFHERCRARDAEGFGWIAARGAGRILRAPTLFEDAVKVLATTNCTWALTRVMVTNMVAAFDRGGAFPDAAFLAGFPEARLRSELKLGYRAPFLQTFATRVASGALDLARWEDPTLSAAALEKEIRAEKGFGPYAAHTLSRLLNRHEGLGIDSWSRKKVAALRFKGRKASDKRITAFYRGFGPFAGLAFWLDVTREWHERTESLWP